MAFIAEATTVLSQTLDYESELERLAALAVPILGDWCVIHVVEPDGDVRLIAIAHEDEELVKRLQVDLPAGVPSVVRTGESILYEEITDDVLTGSDELRELGFRSAMIVPLICRDHVLGTLMLVSGRRYTKEDVRLAEDLAARAAFPIDNARLYQERARVAQTLQESLLPPDLPEIPGVELAARYHAAIEVADVGGDFYDLFATGARNWALVLGDVSGKGVEAAVVTSLARHTLRAAALNSRAPADLLSILNTALLEQTEPDRFVTAVCADIRPRFGRLVVNVACGGHPAPYVVRSDGSVEQIPSEGTLLGIVPDPQLTDVTLELGFGDKIVFYTDGVLEARSGERTFDRNEFESLLHETATRGVGAAADMIVKAVIDFQDGRPRDDIALVVIGVRASIFRRPRRVLHFVRDS
jgi:serine phosphatase RsbU (regulator of sigma subunit)